MSGSTVLSIATEIAFAFLVVALLLAMVRLARGPTLPDRILALDLMSALSVSFVAVFALSTGFLAYLDIAIAIALVGFLATIALARYVLSRGAAPEAIQDSSEASI